MNQKSCTVNFTVCTVLGNAKIKPLYNDSVVSLQAKHNFKNINRSHLRRSHFLLFQYLLSIQLFRLTIQPFHLVFQFSLFSQPFSFFIQPFGLSIQPFQLAIQPFYLAFWPFDLPYQPFQLTYYTIVQIRGGQPRRGPGPPYFFCLLITPWPLAN